jgi:hypothetical protein
MEHWSETFYLDLQEVSATHIEVKKFSLIMSPEFLLFASLLHGIYHAILEIQAWLWR